MFVELLQRVDFSSSTILSTGLVAYFAYIVAQVVYRLYFSPLAGFPGSKLAAATGWYETYYQLAKKGGGQFTFKIAEWHKKYGPIVRINPHEIHIHDPEYYETVYANGHGIDKPDYVEWQFGTPGAVFGTVQHDLHRKRKSALLPFFSKRKAMEQIPQIQEHVAKICERLHNEYLDTDNVLNLCNLFSCFAADVITTYSFDRTFNYLNAQDFISPFTASFDGFKGFVHYSIQFPWLPKILARLPESFIRFLQPVMVPVLNYRRDIRIQIEDIKHRRDMCLEDDRAKGTIFLDILDSSLPESEKTTIRLSDEAAGVVGAGIETTKWALVVTFFHVIDNPPVLQRLRQELKTAFPDSRSIPSFSELESLPYLMACIEEGLRLSYGSVARSPRIHRTKALQYKNYTIPAGTPVSCDAWHAHHDESIFPSSFAFVPERWLDGKKNLSRYTMFFGKGSRMCLGLQLGYAELEMAIATLFRRFDFELYETGREDVDCYHDQISPGVKPESQGVRVKVKTPKD